jgi:hypothetical protein
MPSIRCVRELHPPPHGSGVVTDRTTVGFGHGVEIGLQLRLRQGVDASAATYQLATADGAHDPVGAQTQRAQITPGHEALLLPS